MDAETRPIPRHRAGLSVRRDTVYADRRPCPRHEFKSWTWEQCADFHIKQGRKWQRRRDRAVTFLLSGVAVVFFIAGAITVWAVTR